MSEGGFIGDIRGRCRLVLEAGLRGELAHFAIDLARLEDAAARTMAVTRAAYPDLRIPYHSRWRHFTVAGEDRWAKLAPRADAAELARVRFDLAVVSVLLDAGAGPDWRFRDPEGGAAVARSEGLALASLYLFRDALGLRADAAALARLDEAALARAFQVSEANPLVGLPGRAALLRRLADGLRAMPELFGPEARIGNLADRFGRATTAAEILAAVLRGIPLRRDVWRHPAAGEVPFHKLSQWLTYSLLEPLQDAGVRVSGLEALTGLPEYRNGGLLIDTGVLAPKHGAVLAQAHEVGSEIVVEWRALTVALLDRLAVRVNALLGTALPLASILQGGTWAAGRQIAAEKRASGGPPLRVISDGTVF